MSEISLLQNNFMRADSGKSRYVNGTLAGLRAVNDTDNRMTGMIDTLQVQMADAETTADKVRISRRASAMLRQEREQQVSEGAELVLKQAHQRIEDKAEEAAEKTGDGTQGAQMPELAEQVAVAAYEAQAAATAANVTAPEPTTPAPAEQSTQTSAAVSSVASVDVSV